MGRKEMRALIICLALDVIQLDGMIAQRKCFGCLVVKVMLKAMVCHLSTSYGITAILNSQLGTLNDLWMYRMNDSTWTWIAGNSTAPDVGNYGPINVSDTSFLPASRYAANGWYDSSTQEFWVFGGMNDDGTLCNKALSNILITHSSTVRLFKRFVEISTE